MSGVNGEFRDLGSMEGEPFSRVRALKKEARVKVVLERAGVAAYLSDLVKSPEAGSIAVSSESQSVFLKPEETVKLEIEATQKDGRESVSIRLSWRKDEPVDRHVELRISSFTPTESVEA